LGRELDAIRADIEESRGEPDARYVLRTIQLQRGLAAFNGYLRRPSPIPIRAHVRPDRPHRTPVSPDIDDEIEARLASFMWKTILDTTTSWVWR
jgi:hypothetical protein